MWRERNERGIEGSPPCYQCWVDPDPVNNDAWKIFNINRYQLITVGMEGHILDMNHMPIHDSMRMCKIKDREKCFGKILVLARWWVKKLNEKKG